MIAEKTMHFQGKGWDLKDLTNEITAKLMSDGYQTQSNTETENIIIQASKAGVLRDIIAADRAFTIMIEGTPNDFTIRIGIGKLVQNLAVTAAEAIVLSELFLAIDVPEMIWTKQVENGIAKDIMAIVEAENMGAAPVTAKKPAKKNRYASES
jgi:hypothetical protein